MRIPTLKEREVSLKNILYIPGLGDENTIERQRSVVSKWANGSRRSWFFDPKWHSEEKLKDKKARLDKLFGEINETGEEIQVVASSAGGSLAVILFAKEKKNINLLTLISTKLIKPEKIGEDHRKSTPMLVEAVSECEKLLYNLTESDRSKITTYRPIYDDVIPTKDMKIKGAKNKVVLAAGHAIGITVALFIFKKIR